METITLLINILPLSLAAAVSPTVLVLSAMILNSKSYPKKKIYAFLIGAALVTLSIGFLEITATEGIPMSGKKIFAQHSSYIDIGIGLFLILMGVKKALTHKKNKDGLMFTANSNQQTGKFLLFGGFSMATNFTTLIFYLTALKTINVATDKFFIKAMAIIFINFFILLPITLPLFIYLKSPKNSLKILGKENIFIKKYGNPITIALFLIFGLYFILKATAFLI